MKPFAKKFYHSKVWRKCRASFIKYRLGQCERCINPGQIVHHKILLTPNNIDDPEITLNFRHLELLCQDCHNKEHHAKHSVVAEGLMFDSTGQLVQA
jgi:hypothetical protein